MYFQKIHIRLKKKNFRFSVAAQSHSAPACYAWVHSKSNIGLRITSRQYKCHHVMLCDHDDTYKGLLTQSHSAVFHQLIIKRLR